MPTAEKQERKIPEPKKSLKEEVVEAVTKHEHSSEAPAISDTVSKAKQVLKQAQKAKVKQRKTWRCSVCGDEGIQLYDDGLHDGHFEIVEIDGVPCNPHTEEPLTVTKMSIANNQRGKGKNRN